MAGAESVTRNRLAVWGDPIAHSKSPDLHAAAYRVLGFDWHYGRRQTNTADFTAALAGLDDRWRGLSLTMPLKEAAFQAAATHDRHAELTGAVNTLLWGDVLAGFNTDVGGIVDSLTAAGVHHVERVRILGAGATAASALVAAAEMGASEIEVRARRPKSAIALEQIGQQMGVVVKAHAFETSPEPVDLTIATLPSGTVLSEETVTPLATHGGALFDAAYAPWPSALAVAWGERTVISGLEMLLHQAVRQIRIFDHGDPAVALPHEDAVVAAMRAAL